MKLPLFLFFLFLLYLSFQPVTVGELLTKSEKSLCFWGYGGEPWSILWLFLALFVVSNCGPLSLTSLLSPGCLGSWGCLHLDNSHCFSTFIIVISFSPSRFWWMSILFSIGNYIIIQIYDSQEVRSKNDFYSVLRKICNIV